MMSSSSPRSTIKRPPSSSSSSEGGGGAGGGSTNAIGATARAVYEVSGDAAAALPLLMMEDSSSSSSSPAVKAYNRCLLEMVIASDDQEQQVQQQQEQQQQQRPSLSMWMTKLEETAEQVVLSSSSSSSGSSNYANINTTTTTRKRKRDEWIMTYNRGLGMLTCGRAQESMEWIWETFQPLLSLELESTSSSSYSGETTKLSQELLGIACRMAFLLLEGVLTLSVACPMGIPQFLKGALELEALLQWLNRAVEDCGETDPQLKFLLSLYKGRLDFLHRDDQGKLVEAKIRSARKELKQAMEIFQHKLKPNPGTTTTTTTTTTTITSTSNTNTNNTNDSASLASSTGVSINNNNNNEEYHHASPAQTSNQQHHTSEHQSMSSVLQGQNQAALNLKANTEQLKGNVKKSLILCSEAAQASQGANSTLNNVNGNGNATTADGNPTSANAYYHAFHYNNLAIVYETHGKPHLALHAWSKALQQQTQYSSSSTSTTTTTGPTFQSDGTARPDATLKLLHNAAIGSLQAGNFVAAYECMGTCLQHSLSSMSWSSKPRCWLRLAEACIGVLSNNNKKKKQVNDQSKNRFSKVEVEG
jgi:hypothetical protein